MRASTWDTFEVGKGEKITIRPPKFDDLKSYLYFVNSLVEEGAMINRNKKVTLKEEKEWLKKAIGRVKRGERFCLVAVCDGRIIGSAEVERGFGRMSHVGFFGIAVLGDYRERGIGKRLADGVINIARKHKIKRISLDVFETNKTAIRFYKKLGFRKVATLPKRLYYKGKYINSLVFDCAPQTGASDA
jgi:putative acetyltransferase